MTDKEIIEQLKRENKALLETSTPDTRVALQESREIANKARMMEHRAELLEKQLERVAGILDHLVPVLFGDRLGQKELGTDPMFQAFKYVRGALDKKELGMPHTMAKDFKPGFFGKQ
jgi:hypothetical protein